MAAASATVVRFGGAASAAAVTREEGVSASAVAVPSTVTDKLFDPFRAFVPTPVTLAQVEGLIPSRSRSHLADIIFSRDIEALQKWIDTTPAGRKKRGRRKAKSVNREVQIANCVAQIPGCAPNIRIPAFHLCIVLGFYDGFEILAQKYLHTITEEYEEVGFDKDNRLGLVKNSATYIPQELLCDHRGNTPVHYAALMEDARAFDLCKRLELPYTLNDWDGFPSDIAMLVKHPKTPDEVSFHNTIKPRDLLIVWWKHTNEVRPNSDFALRSKAYDLYISGIRKYVIEADGLGGLGCRAVEHILPGELIDSYSAPVASLYSAWHHHHSIGSFATRYLGRGGAPRNPLGLLTEAERGNIEDNSRDVMQESGADPASGLATGVTLINDGVPNARFFDLPLMGTVTTVFQATNAIRPGQNMLIFYGSAHPVRWAHVPTDFDEMLRKINLAIAFYSELKTLLASPKRAALALDTIGFNQNVTNPFDHLDGVSRGVRERIEYYIKEFLQVSELKLEDFALFTESFSSLFQYMLMTHPVYLKMVNELDARSFNILSDILVYSELVFSKMPSIRRDKTSFENVSMLCMLKYMPLGVVSKLNYRAIIFSEAIRKVYTDLVTEKTAASSDEGRKLFIGRLITVTRFLKNEESMARFDRRAGAHFRENGIVDAEEQRIWIAEQMRFEIDRVEDELDVTGEFRDFRVIGSFRAD